MPEEINGENVARVLRAVVARERVLIARAGAIALYREAQTLRTASLRLVPVDLGALRSSATVSEAIVSDTSVYVEVGYGGPAAPYALAVHEIPPPPAKSPRGRSARHRPPTQWKYLEKPAREQEHGMGDRLAATMRAELERSRRRV